MAMLFLSRRHRICAIGVLAVSTLCGARAARAVTVIDDFTEVTYSVPAGPIGSFADHPVTRTFDGDIKSIQVEIVSGSADDIGYVGDLLVTDVKPSCANVGSVVAPVDVTSQVTVSGATASFVLRAQENCCCVTGWGPATQGDRPPAVFHWHVEVANTCEPDANGACGECKGDLELADEAKASFKVDGTVDCPRNVGGGKAGLELEASASGSLSAANCESSCKGKLELAGNLSGTLFSCGRRSKSVSAGFSYKEDRQFGTFCNQDSCEEECDFTRSCIESESTGTVEFTIGNSINQDFTLHPPGVRSISVTALCDVEQSWGHKVDFIDKLHFPQGLEPCENCNEQTFGYTLSANAAGSCMVELTGFGKSFQFGCDSCVTLSAQGSFSGTRRVGPDCAGGACAAGSFGATGTLKAPEHCLSLFGYVVKARVSASASGTCSKDTCTGKSGCDVKATGTLDITTEQGDTCK